MSEYLMVENGVIQFILVVDREAIDQPALHALDYRNQHYPNAIVYLKVGGQD